MKPVCSKIPNAVVQKIVKENVETPGVAVLGSFARGKPFCDDIDLLVVGGQTIEFKCPYEKQSGGKKRAVYILFPRGMDCGVHTDVYFITKEEIQAGSLPFMVTFLLGPKEANIKLRLQAKKMGYILNQYGLFKKAKSRHGHGVRIKTVGAIYDFLGMEFKVKAIAYTT